jgi:hypothetical protein
MNKERQRNEDGRGGDVIVQDSIANGRPDLPIDRDPGRETSIAINADELGSGNADTDRAEGSDAARSEKLHAEGAEQQRSAEQAIRC